MVELRPGEGGQGASQLFYKAHGDRKNKQSDYGWPSLSYKTDASHFTV